MDLVYWACITFSHTTTPGCHHIGVCPDNDVTITTNESHRDLVEAVRKRCTAGGRDRPWQWPFAVASTEIGHETRGTDDGSFPTKRGKGNLKVRGNI